MYIRGTGIPQFRSIRYLQHTIVTMEAAKELNGTKTVSVYVIVAENNHDDNDASTYEDASSSEVNITNRPTMSPTEIPTLVTQRPTEKPSPVTQCPTEKPSPVTQCPTEIPPPVPPRPLEMEIELDNPPIRHGALHTGILIQAGNVTAMKAVSSKIPVRKRTVILMSTLVFAAVTLASIIGGTLILSKGKDTKKR